MMIQLMSTTNRHSRMVISMGDYLVSMRVRANSSRVKIVTRQITVSIRVFTVSTRELSGNTMNTVGGLFAWCTAVGWSRAKTTVRRR